jgi:aryl-alcohol dehydrogenase-like predicted oxidoreductase
MVKRPLGKTGIQVSELAFGCVEIGIPYGIGVHSKNDMLTEQEAIALLQAALEKGINFFDTARMYGVSENIIGKAFRHNRQQVVIATKCKHIKREDGSLPGDDALREIITSSLQQSLEAMQTDQVDVYMLHQADLDILHNKAVTDTFVTLKKSGLTRAIGVSTYTNEQTELAISAGCWDVVQLPFNLMDQRQASCFKAAHENGIAIMIRSVLLKGLLSDKGKNLHPALAAVEAHLEKFGQLASKAGMSLSSLATRFALSFSEVSSILVGIDKLSYLQQSIDAANGIQLNQEILGKARMLAYPVPEFLDLPNWDKQGWLK